MKFKHGKRIWLSLAHMGGEEQKYIQQAFDTNWVVPLGPNVDGFEKDLQDFLHEDKHLVALSSGTAALHLALLQLGVGPGDEVICQSFTFSASANPIAYLHATPVFVDSEPETWNMDPVLMEEAIRDCQAKTGKLPKAIIPVHLYGMPAKMDQIMEIANRWGIPVVEDAAEALGAAFQGRKCGTFGEYGILSFNGNKIITTSGGGALICSTEEQAAKTKFYATQARDQAPHYQHSEIGYNYRLSNICAGIGRGQMKVLQKHVDRRREINHYYRQKLGHIPGISFQTEPDSRFTSNYWLTSILVNPELTGGKTREDLRLFLEGENIETRPLWKPMHLQPVFAQTPSYCNGVSEALFRDGLCLPSGSILSEEDLNRVAEAIIRFFEN
jgi:dTDP-4-amino-4,6-dideoxygalactose transaminase